MAICYSVVKRSTEPEKTTTLKKGANYKKIRGNLRFLFLKTICMPIQRRIYHVCQITTTQF